jgi:hypothetical protein
MPVVFIHGVNTRDGDEYRKDVAARDELLKRLVLEPLGARGANVKDMEIVSPYWGNHGVSFAWNQATLPDVDMLEDLGAGSEVATPASDMEMAATIKELAGTGQAARRASAPPGLEALGSSEGDIKKAAEADLGRFIEAVLGPIIFSEMDLSVGAGETPAQVGIYEALLVVAARQVAADPAVKAAIGAASSDDEVMALLKTAVQSRFEQVVAGSAADAEGGQLEALGPGWLDALTGRIGDIFDRAKNAPARAATLPLLDKFREMLHRNFSRFLGDVFVYINERGTKENPGPIVATVLQAIKSAPRHHENEPLVIVTHSMGGNILYDILTTYAPDLKVDAWISVAGQVGQFEEMKLFRASDKTLVAPNKVAGLKPRVKYWLNVYDPADVFGFKAAPVFADVDDDVKFLTAESTVKAHSAFFKRAGFYELVLGHLEGALL